MKPKKITFRDAAIERAGQLARTRAEDGDDLQGGAILAIDPRDDFGLDLSSAAMSVEQDISISEAKRYLSDIVAKAKRAGGCAAVCQWSDSARLHGFLTEIKAASDADKLKQWLTVPIESGFYRLAMLTHRRFSYEIVPYLPMAEA